MERCTKQRGHRALKLFSHFRPFSVFCFHLWVFCFITSSSLRKGSEASLPSPRVSLKNHCFPFTSRHDKTIVAFLALNSSFVTLGSKAFIQPCFPPPGTIGLSLVMRTQCSAPER